MLHCSLVSTLVRVEAQYLNADSVPEQLTVMIACTKEFVYSSLDNEKVVVWRAIEPVYIKVKEEKKWKKFLTITCTYKYSDTCKFL